MTIKQLIKALQKADDKEQKEYIIVDSNNQWLSTEKTKREALKVYQEIKRQMMGGGQYADMDLGDEIWLYEAKFIKNDKI